MGGVDLAVALDGEGGCAYAVHPGTLGDAAHVASRGMLASAWHASISGLWAMAVGRGRKSAHVVCSGNQHNDKAAAFSPQSVASALHSKSSWYHAKSACKRQ